MKNRRLYYTVKEVAELLSVHEKSVYRWTDRGHLKCVVVAGRTLRISQQQLDDFLATQKPRKRRRRAA